MKTKNHTTTRARNLTPAAAQRREWLLELREIKRQQARIVRDYRAIQRHTATQTRLIEKTTYRAVSNLTRKEVRATRALDRRAIRLERRRAILHGRIYS